MARLRAVALDWSPLRSSRSFARLWAGSGLSQMGSQMTSYAVVLQVFLLTRSSLMVGLVGACIAFPSVVVSMLAGPMIDRVDRRSILLVGTVAQMVISGALCAQAFLANRGVALLYGLVVAQASVGAINTPVRRTFLATLLKRDELTTGAALQALLMHASVTIGPALAGLLTGAFGLKVCYLVDALSFGFALYGVVGLPISRLGDAAGASRGARAILEGLGFIRRQKVLVGAFVTDMSATFFGMPMALFPAINAARFGGSAETLGLLTSAVALGGVVGSLCSGPAIRLERQGLGMLVSSMIWGLGLVGFGFSSVLLPALLCLVVAGAGDVTTVVLRTTIVQQLTPDRLRGRVSASDFAVAGGVPQLGNLRAGIVAQASSPGFAAVLGGVSAMGGVLVIACAIPGFRTYRGARGPRGSDRGDVEGEEACLA